MIVVRIILLMSMIITIQEVPKNLSINIDINSNCDSNSNSGSVFFFRTKLA